MYTSFCDLLPLYYVSHLIYRADQQTSRPAIQHFTLLTQTCKTWDTTFTVRLCLHVLNKTDQRSGDLSWLESNSDLRSSQSPVHSFNPDSTAGCSGVQRLSINVRLELVLYPIKSVKTRGESINDN